LPATELPLSDAERRYLEPFLSGEQTLELEDVFARVDAAWDECDCDQKVMDERVTRFYRHPVWLLNGLFIEQHEPSLANRRVIAEWVKTRSPRRVADFGGGHGTLARMIGEACPDAEVEIAEPNPHPAAIARAAETGNVRYVPGLTGAYDVILATDVFEHVPDPLALVEETAAHLGPEGVYVMANGFRIEMKCHLPMNYHFRWSWETAMSAMNLRLVDRVSYGGAYAPSGPISAKAARTVERRSRLSYGIIQRTPPRRQPRVVRMLIGVPK
jgi:SAM-dependent methyltransferase